MNMRKSVILKKLRNYMLVPLLAWTLVAGVDVSTGETADYMPKLEDSLSGFIKDGKILLDIRTRFEYASQDGLKSSNAFTIHTRLGYQAPEFKGFVGLIEMENNIPLDSDSYDAYPGSQGYPGKTIIADPRNTEINRAQLSYEGFDTLLTAGRQRIILDNYRFLGNVGWRQNEQTFDGATIINRSIKDLALYYGYLDRANRIFGVEADVEAQRYFEMDSHIINAVYSGCPFGKVGCLRLSAQDRQFAGQFL